MKNQKNNPVKKNRFPANLPAALKSLTGMIALCSLSSPVMLTAAGGESGWGARFFAGIDNGQTDRIDANLNGFAYSDKVDLDSGTFFGAAVDYTWSNGFSAELEYTYRTADFSSAPNAIFPNASEADIASVLIFANFLYRPVIESMPRLQPRLGIGLGWLQETSMDVLTDGVEESFDGSGTAYQLVLGADYSLTEKWLIGLDLHWYSAGSVDLKGELDSQRKLELDYDGFSLLASVSYRF